MANKIYPLVLLVVIAALTGLGIYLYSQETTSPIFPLGPQKTLPPEIQEMGKETNNISQDIDDLNELGASTGLENMDKDLTAISGEEGLVDLSSITDMETEIIMDLDGFSNDLSDLSDLESDASLNLDSSLSNLSQ